MTTFHLSPYFVFDSSKEKSILLHFGITKNVITSLIPLLTNGDSTLFNVSLLPYPSTQRFPDNCALTIPPDYSARDNSARDNCARDNCARDNCARDNCARDNCAPTIVHRQFRPGIPPIIPPPPTGQYKLV